MDEKKSIFDDIDVERDDDIDVLAALDKAKEEIESKKEELEKDEVTENNDASINNIPVKTEKLTPLEQLKKAKNESTKGIIYANDEMVEEKAPTKRDIAESEEVLTEVEETIKGYDDDLKKRELVVVIKKPTNAIEYIQMMDELSSVNVNPDGSIHFDLKDREGNPVNPQYFRAREKGEPAFDFSLLNEFEIEEMKKRGTYTEEVANNVNAETNETNESEDAESEDKEDKISPEKKKIVEVLIDKTGLGGDFVFTEEEKSKIEEASTIRVNEVKFVDIKSIKSKRSQKSYQDIISEYNYSGEKTTICFPASGFKASMKGLSYGEYADISLSTETVTFDKYYKRLSVIYNKMTNISTGPFKDFEDFLKHFAYTDIEMALYGLYISTEKEKQEVPLRCGNNSCGNTFNWQFNTRSLIKLNRCSDTFLSNMQKIATASAMDYDKIRDEAAVNNSKVIQLPDSGILCEMGIASAYDFLYNFVPLMNDQAFIDAFGENYNEIYRDNALLLTCIRTVYLPDGEGGYVECTGYKEILDAIYNVGPTEIQILAAYTAKIQSNWELVFSFGDVVCPHCSTVTKNLDISMDELVFQTYNRLMSTQIDLSNVQDI